MFTVCPANSDTTSSNKWMTSKFVDGAALHTCYCGKGYMGAKGRECQACAKGKYSSIAGAPQCSECSVGRHCSCSTSGNCRHGSELPACSQCASCLNGQFQSSSGQSECLTCQNGFNCKSTGMTYPVVSVTIHSLCPSAVRGLACSLTVCVGLPQFLR